MFCLPYRAVIGVEGNQSLELLQSLLTNDVYKTDFDKELGYGFFLTPQGKIITDCFVSLQEGMFMLDIPEINYSYLLERLNFYKIGRKITLLDLRKEGYKVLLSKRYGLLDPRTDKICRIISACDVENNEAIYDEYRHSTLKNAMPEFGLYAESNKFYPIFFEYAEVIKSVNYEKGCYVGQEVTARNKYRNVVRKKAYYISSINSHTQYMDEITMDGEAIGRIIDIHKGEGIGLLEKSKAELFLSL